MRVVVGIWDEKGKLICEEPFDVDSKCPCGTVFEAAAWLSKKIV